MNDSPRHSRANWLPWAVIVLGLAVGWLVTRKPAQPVAQEDPWANASRTQLTAQVQASLRGFMNIPDDLTQAMATCVVDKLIPFLLSSECTRQADPQTTSREEHVRALDACLKNRGYQGAQEQAMRTCIVQIYPHDWVHMTPAFVQREEQVHSAMPQPQRSQYAQCIAQGYVQALNAAHCDPINRTATSMKDLWNRQWSQCVGHETDAALQARCAAGASPAPTSPPPSP